MIRKTTLLLLFVFVACSISSVFFIIYKRQTDQNLLKIQDFKNQKKTINFAYTGIDKTYEMPIYSLIYIPTTKNSQIDKAITGPLNTLSVNDLKEKVLKLMDEGVKSLNISTKYKGYKNSKAINSLNYYIYTTKYVESDLPEGLEVPWKKNQNIYRPDYIKILNSINICDLVDNKGIKVVWLWGYHFGTIEPAESNMSMGLNIRKYWNKGLYGDVSNSEQSNDMPICNNTYVLYNMNYGRELGELLENHAHHVESVMNFVDSAFWNDKFVGNCQKDVNITQCGSVHYPPNVSDVCSGQDYSWYSKSVKDSYCINWSPDKQSQATQISCETWGGKDCPQDGGSSYKVWWMQNIPGIINNLTYNNKKLKNFWSFIGDFDTNIADKKFFYD